MISIETILNTEENNLCVILLLLRNIIHYFVEYICLHIKCSAVQNKFYNYISAII